MPNPQMYEQDVVIHMTFQSSIEWDKLPVQDMRRALARYWAISENSKAFDVTLNGKPVPKLRPPLVRSRVTPKPSCASKEMADEH